MEQEKQKESFVFYRSFFEALDNADEQTQLIMYRAIAMYGLNRTEPELTGLALVMWKLIKPQMEANWRRFENGCKGASYGNRGGAPMGNRNAMKSTPNQRQPVTKTTPKQPQINPKTTPNVNDNVNDNENDKDITRGNPATAPAVDDVSLVESKQRFETWWNLYDKKKDRANAEKLFIHLRPAEQLAAIHNTPRYVEATPEKRYRKDPTTYLRHKSWNDEVIDNTPERGNQRPQRGAAVDFDNDINKDFGEEW